MKFVLLITIILGGTEYPQPAKYFNTLEECQYWIPKNQELKQNLQIVGKCHEIIGEVYEQ